LILTILHYSAIIYNRAIRSHIHSGNFRCREYVSKKNLQVAARRIFECVRTRTTLPEAEREVKLWDWLLGTEQFDLCRAVTLGRAIV